MIEIIVFNWRQEKVRFRIECEGQIFVDHQPFSEYQLHRSKSPLSITDLSDLQTVWKTFLKIPTEKMCGIRAAWDRGEQKQFFSSVVIGPNAGIPIFVGTNKHGHTTGPIFFCNAKPQFFVPDSTYDGLRTVIEYFRVKLQRYS